VSLNFNAAAATALFKAVQSYAEKLALFQSTETHEPENAPGQRLYCSIVLGSPAITCDGGASGLAAVSGTITLIARIWSSATQRPLDKVDPEVLSAACSLMAALAGGFTLGGTIRNIDLFRMTMQPAWADFDGRQFRVAEITIPAVINDLWTEAE
jgi:hypothetical protein